MQYSSVRFDVITPNKCSFESFRIAFKINYFGNCSIEGSCPQLLNAKLFYNTSKEFFLCICHLIFFTLITHYYVLVLYSLEGKENL